MEEELYLIQNSDIEKQKRLIANEMSQSGFSNVRVNRLEVAGEKDGYYVSIARFPVCGNQYWEIVMCSYDTVEQARRNIDEVVTMLRTLKV